MASENVSESGPLTGLNSGTAEQGRAENKGITILNPQSSNEDLEADLRNTESHVSSNSSEKVDGLKTSEEQDYQAGLGGDTVSGPVTESAPEPVAESTSQTDTPDEFLEDEAETPRTVDGFIDYNAIYENLQTRFGKAYSMSQKLFVTEKAQRQALYQYKRRVNALLDVLSEMEANTEDINETLPIDQSRLASLVTWRPELASSLEPALKIAAGEDPASIPLKRSYAVNLAVDEIIPDITYDESDPVEVNPQNTEMWIRRNFSHLILSKFRPAEVRSKGVREYVDPLPQGSKRRKR